MSGPFLLEFVGGPLCGCYGHQSYAVKFVDIPVEFPSDEAAILPTSKTKARRLLGYRYEVRRLPGGSLAFREGRLLYDFRGFVS